MECDGEFLRGLLVGGLLVFGIVSIIVGMTVADNKIKLIKRK